MSPTVITTDQFLVTASIGTAGQPGFVDLGQWAGHTGGDINSTINDHFFGGMQPAVPAGSRRTMDVVQLRRPFAYGDGGLIINLAPRVGRAQVRCAMQPLDADGHPFGAGFVETGLLQDLIRPEHDAASEGDGTPWGINIKPGATLGATNT